MEDSNHESDDRSRGTLATIASALVPSFIQRRYALKFLVSILIVVIVISSVGAYGFLQAEGAVRTSTENQLTETSELRADSLNEWLEKMNLQTRTVSAGKPLQQNEQQAAYLVTEQERMSDDVLAVHLIDTGEGTVKTSTEFPLEGIALSDLEERDVPWANADVPSGAGENDKVWMSSRSYRSPVMDDKPVIAFASSVPDQPNQYVVVIARVQGHLDRIQNSETNQETQIINTNGETVLQIDQEVDADVHESHINDTRQNGSVLFQKTDQEAHAYAYVEKSDWVAITTVDNEHAFAVRDTVAQNVGLIIVSALLTLCLVGFVLGRQTVVPLTALRERAQRMEEGDLDVDLQTHRTDEIGRLYDGFDSMRNSLR
ncbi:HAMP domain-containing protein, partial [Natrinema salaciae]